MFFFTTPLPWPLPDQMDMSHQDQHAGQHFMNGKWMKNSDMQGMAGMHGMMMMPMVGTFAPTARSQEGSGTAWLPASSPHHMWMPGGSGRYQLEVMGQAQFGYTWSGGPRGSNQAFSNSMIMIDAPRTFADGQKVNFRFMTSLDPIFDGESGVPNLFQTGETAFGKALVDRQHPHNLFSEIAGSYSRPVGKDYGVFVYGGPVGEPALADTMYLHRPSGMEVPEAPITHHWFDSAHISNGVVTLGATKGSTWKVDASAFNGREPGENRFTIDPIKLDSYSGRVTYNPSADWSLSASYGYLKSPEALNPLEPEHRLTASIFYNHHLGHDLNLALAGMFGRDIHQGYGTNGYNFEATVSNPLWSFFTRYENVGKDELTGVPAGTYTINKVVMGAVRNYRTTGGFELGFGAYVGLYSFPSSLDPYYGHGPVTYGVFWRVRPAQME